MKTKASFIVIPLVLFLFSFPFLHRADSQEVEKKEASGHAGPKFGAEAGMDYDELARFLAGMPIPKESRLFPLTRYASYGQHVKFMDTFWERVQKEVISKIDSWREKNLKGLWEENPAFYPLSGADFINLRTFFPNASSYVMVALERTGDIPELHKLTDAQLGARLRSIDRFIESISLRNYLIYRTMIDETKTISDMGVLPVLLIFSARMNLSVKNIERITLSKEGLITAVTDGKADRGGVQGIRMTFTSPGRGEQSVIYLKAQLEGDSLSGNSATALFFRRINGCNTLIKSAMYLFHLPRYAGLCRDIIANSSVIIQDDSGIPYRFVAGSGLFDIKLFGIYIRPTPLTDYPRPPHQADLAKGYKRERLPLPFKFSYGALQGLGNSNLHLAVRVDQKSIAAKADKETAPLTAFSATAGKKAAAREQKKEAPVLPLKVAAVGAKKAGQTVHFTEKRAEVKPLKRKPGDVSVSERKALLDLTSMPEIPSWKEFRMNDAKKIEEIIDQTRFRAILPGHGTPHASLKNWSVVFSVREVYNWGRTLGLELKENRPPIRYSKACFVTQHGSRVKLAGLSRGRTYTLWIDFIAFDRYRSSVLPTTLKIFHEESGSLRQTLIKEINYGEIARAGTLCRVDIPYQFSIRGEVDLVFREYSPTAGFWGFWDMILSETAEYPVMINIDGKNTDISMARAKTQILFEK